MVEEEKKSRGVLFRNLRFLKWGIQFPEMRTRLEDGGEDRMVGTGRGGIGPPYRATLTRNLE